MCIQNTWVYSVHGPGRHWTAYLSPGNLPDASDRRNQTYLYRAGYVCAENSGAFYLMLTVTNGNCKTLSPTNMSSQVANESCVHHLLPCVLLCPVYFYALCTSTPFRFLDLKGNPMVKYFPLGRTIHYLISLTSDQMISSAQCGVHVYRIHTWKIFWSLGQL